MKGVALRIKEADAERGNEIGVILHREYEISALDTLSTLNLERGDALPDDATAEIVSAAIKQIPHAGRQTKELSRIAVVEAQKIDAWAD